VSLEELQSLLRVRQKAHAVFLLLEGWVDRTETQMTVEVTEDASSNRILLRRYKTRFSLQKDLYNSIWDLESTQIGKPSHTILRECLKTIDNTIAELSAGHTLNFWKHFQDKFEMLETTVEFQDRITSIKQQVYRRIGRDGR